MYIYIKYSLLIVLSSVILSGCAEKQPKQPELPKVSTAEVGKYEKAYMAEYQKIKQKKLNDKKYVKWIQAANKKEECKIFVGYNPNDDRTEKIGYKIYWDGKCKNGYAYGLGREFEKGLLTDMEAIALYNGGKNKPKYYYYNYKLKNQIHVGNLNKFRKVKTTIVDNGMNFNIEFENVYTDLENKIQYLIKNSPFSNNVIFAKIYPNFTYLITDYTKNEFDNRKYEFRIIDAKSGELNGFGFVALKNGQIIGYEMAKGNLLRKVQLPQSFFDKADSIFKEIKDKIQLALNAQQKALMIKRQYKNKICKDSVKINFMDNNEYKAICKEDERNAEIKEKIEKKLAQIEQQKQAKREKQYKERMLRAKEMEAMAEQQKAITMEQRNKQEALKNFNQSMQNMNTNTQLQQLNNTLMMYNFMQ